MDTDACGKWGGVVPTTEDAEAKLEITDRRTNRTYELEIVDGAVRAPDLRQIKASECDFGLLSYDPAFVNTASCRSTITFIDGEKGILRYRGYPIEELAVKKTFLEVAYLLLHGELPTPNEIASWSSEIARNAGVHEAARKLIDAFPYDAHPMGVLGSVVAGLSTFYPEAKQVDDPTSRATQVIRLIAKMPTIAAFIYRHNRGLPYVYPDPTLTYTGNLLTMLWRGTANRNQPHPVLQRALDVLLTLHADHEQNCSTSTMRLVGSSLADPYAAMSGACAALYGPLHGGANEQVLLMLNRIGTKAAVPEYIQRVKDGEFRLMGFGHRVYKNFDPRAQLIKRIADEVFEVTGPSPLLQVAQEIERIALEDEYFVSHKLYPNVDFYSGIIYLAMGLPVGMFPVLFAIGRTPGWLAHWVEGVQDPEQRIGRPRQLYVGRGERHLQ